MKLLYPLIFLLLSCSTEPEDVHGCLDSSACNYNSSATIDNGTCTFAEEGLDCAGNCEGGLPRDCAGVCGGDAEPDYSNGVYECCTLEYEEDWQCHNTYGYNYTCWSVPCNDGFAGSGCTTTECGNIWGVTGSECDWETIEVTECFNLTCNGDVAVIGYDCE